VRRVARTEEDVVALISYFLVYQLTVAREALPGQERSSAGWHDVRNGPIKDPVTTHRGEPFRIVVEASASWRDAPSWSGGGGARESLDHVRRLW